jgi:alanine transaminase
MVPIPQYPLYSATIAEFDMEQVGYYLNESKNWGMDVSELQRAIDEAKKVSAVRAIVIINPGNPTGQVLSRENIEEIIKFAYKENLFIFADEVYQDNIYAQGSKFHSFKKVLTEMGEPYSKMPMASFMSCSKGYMGECGIRGGYAEVINMCPDVQAMLLKSISAQLCPTTVGQACIDCVVNPPRKGEPSYELFMKEKNGVLQALHDRAEMVAKTFNSIEGFSCNPVQGAMYAFPQIKLPSKAIEAAKKANQSPDAFYAFQLLENTGICIVPGSGFGQQPGTYHFRTTILPQTDKLKGMLDLFKSFHEKFLAQYK